MLRGGSGYHKDAAQPGGGPGHVCPPPRSDRWGSTPTGTVGFEL